MTSSTRIRWARVVALLLAALSPCPASAWAGPTADTDKPASMAPQDETTLVRQGAASFLHHDYESARVALRQAYALNPRADTLLKLGMAELQSGHPVEAVEHLREYLQHNDEPAAKLDLVRSKWLPRAEAATARLEVFAPAGAQVRVDGVAQEAAAASTLDEVRAGKPSLSIVVSAGEHDVSAHQGTITEVKHVVARGGELVELHFQRVPDAPAATLAGGIAPSPRNTPPPSGDARTRAKRITVLALGSAALAAAGVAVGFSIAFEENAADARALRQRIGNGGCLPPGAAQCTGLWQVDDAEQRNGALATGFYVASGAAAVLGAASWFLWPNGKGSALHASPMIGEGTTGVALGGAW